MKNLFFEYLGYKLGIVSSITAAIRLLNRFPKKWIWKTNSNLPIVQTYQKRKEVPYLERSRDNNQKKERISQNGKVTWQWSKSKKSPHMKMPHYNDWKKRMKATVSSSENILHLSLSKIIQFFPAISVLFPPTGSYNTTASLKNLTMWTLANLKTDFNNILGLKNFPITWM